MRTALPCQEMSHTDAISYRGQDISAAVTLQCTFGKHTRKTSVVEVGIDEGDPEKIQVCVNIKQMSLPL